jgi:superfamily II RNA helicase
MNTAPLNRLLPPAGMLSGSELLSLFLEYVKEKGLELYPAQEEAILALYDGQNVIMNTPTGSGKSLVATALHFLSLASGRKSIYTCPIKALVNEKFLALCKDFGADLVGMITGDGSVNPEAPILCCTAEILSNRALREGEHTPIEDIVMDEFHYYSDRERGVAWQVPLLTMPKSRFLLMSATLGDTAFFEDELTKLTSQTTVTIKSAERPVPLDFVYSETPLGQEITDLIQSGKAPIYLVNFTQRDAAEEAQNLLSIDFCSKDEKKKIAEALIGARFTSPFGKELQKLLRHGVGLHHAGLLPKYRILVEKLAQQGLLKVICGTDTLGVGVNIPIRTVLFTKLCKFDGEKTTVLTVRDFQQIAGRAGRKGFDDKGTVVAQAPEHVIENLSMERKAAGDPKKLKRLVKKKPPEKGFVPWNKETFERLIASPPEALRSRFNVTHGMLLNVLSRPHEDGCRAMRDLIRRCHESSVQKERLRKTGFQLFRSLIDRDIISFDKSPGRRAKLHLNVSLQDDFSLNQTLSLWLLDTLKLLDFSAPTYALDVLTLVESILENPDLILRRQLDVLKGEKVHELKAQGIEYEERMAELEKLEYPKPLRDFVYDTFNDFASKHPWIGQENIRPKSIARDMHEQFLSFIEYIREYDLERSEGLLLRYLSEVYKVLAHTVPPSARTAEVEDLVVYFGAMIRAVDSSLIDEWEKLRNPEWVGSHNAADLIESGVVDITRDERAFGVLVRNDVFRMVRAIARGRADDLFDLIEPASGITNEPWTVPLIKQAMAPYFVDHPDILTDATARSPAFFRLEKSKDLWKIEQILCDSDGHNDWQLNINLDLTKSREAGKPVLRLDSITPIG